MPAFGGKGTRRIPGTFNGIWGVGDHLLPRISDILDCPNQ